MGLAGYRGPERTSPVARLDPHQITSKIASVPLTAKPIASSLKRNASPSPRPTSDQEPVPKRQKTDGEDGSRGTSPVSQPATKATTTIIEVLNPSPVTKTISTPEETSTKGVSPASSSHDQPATTPVAKPLSPNEEGEVDEIEEEVPVEKLPATVLETSVDDNGKRVEEEIATEPLTEDLAASPTLDKNSGEAVELTDTAASVDKSAKAEETKEREGDPATAAA
jgi:hypothetical protein